MILGYQIKPSANGTAIKQLVQTASLEYKPNKVQLLSDGGSENVNNTVANFTETNHIKHLIAQKDVAFSNSMIEAINKIIKHQFLHPKEIPDGKHLTHVLEQIIPVYNNIRPQMSLGGNTPNETFQGKTIDFSVYSKNFHVQKVIRIIENTKTSCVTCH